jgi:predicted GNAT family acetyltransferase
MADVRDAPDRRRYEVYDGTGALAGFTTYATRPGKIIFVHTEIDPAFEGHGLGRTLVKGELDDARARGLRVVPLCSFVAAYVERHPEYDEIVDHAALDALNGPA